MPFIEKKPPEKNTVPTGTNGPNGSQVKSLPKLLVVEDQKTDVLLVKHLVKNRYQLFSAPTATDAMKILTTEKDISLILMDIMLPVGKNGIELAVDLKSSPEFGGIPILAVSGYAKADAVKYVSIPGIAAAGNEAKLNELFADYLEKGRYDNATLTAKIDQYAIPLAAAGQ